MRLLAVAVAGRGLVDPAEPVFGAGDEALLRGSAAFETLRVYAGRPFRLDAHLDRLAFSAGRLGLPAPAGAGDLARQVVDAAGDGDLALRLYCTAKTVVAVASALPDGLDELRARGLRLATVEARLDALLAGVKATSYASAFAARAEAERRGANDALLVAADGTVLEATTANVWWSERDELLTPSLDLGILPGVTREALLQLAEKGREGIFPLERLLAADEVFTSSSLREVMPVVEVDGRRIGNGWPGPAAAALHASLRAEAVTGPE